jgi:hypothetical protein
MDHLLFKKGKKRKKEKENPFLVVISEFAWLFQIAC